MNHHALRYRNSGLLRHLSVASLIATIVLTLTACSTIRLIAVYDEETDKNVTALQKKVDTFLVRVRAQDGLPECTYSKHKSIYNELDVDATAIQVRAAAIPQNQVTTEQIDEVQKIIASLERLHRSQEDGYASKLVDSPCIPISAIDNARNRTNAAFIKVLELELAKRRGEK